MARERQQTVIDGHRYEMTMFPATESYRLFHRLLKIIGPAFGKIVDAMGDGDIQDVDLSNETTIEAIIALTTHIKESDLDHVIDKLRNCTHVGVDGSDKTVPLKGIFEMHFAGALASMFRWLLWGLQVQYANFIEGFGSMMPQKEADESPEPKNPTP